MQDAAPFATCSGRPSATISDVRTLPDMTRFKLGEAESPACLDVGDSLDCFLQEPDVDVLALQLVVIVQAVCVDERHELSATFGDEFFSALGVDFLAEIRQMCAGITKLDAVFRCNCHDVFWPSGSCDFETRHFGGDPPKLQYVAGHDRGADFTCCEGDEHIVHRTQSVGQSGRIPI